MTIFLNDERDYTPIVEAWVREFFCTMDEDDDLQPGNNSGYAPEGVKIIFDGYGDLETDDEYVENQRWVVDEVLFVTLHIVGSNNNFESRDAEAIKEFFERDAANVAWIRSAFDLAQQNKYKAIVFAFQADVLVSRSMWEDFPSWSGFRNSFAQTLLPLAKAWAQPVLLIHGDGHQYHFDQPYKLKGVVIPNVTRLEVPGASDVRAVKVTIDLDKEKVFSTELLKP